MWDTIVPQPNCSWEPVELRILKQELANMSCKCNACETFKSPSDHNRRGSNDEAIQVDQKNILLNRYVYANPEIPIDLDELPNMANDIRNNTFCPNCYFIWDLLRRAKKVYKDEESESKPDCIDRATGRIVKFMDSSTQPTNKPVLKPMSSNLTLCDFLSECSSDSLCTAHSQKKSNHDRVTFLEDFPHVDSSKMKPEITMHGNCFCLENYIDSIRPPLRSVH